MSDSPRSAWPDIARLPAAFAGLVRFHLGEGAVSAHVLPGGVLQVRFPSPDGGGPALDLLPLPPAGGAGHAAGPFGWVRDGDVAAPGGERAWAALQATCAQLADDPRFAALHVANTDLQTLSLDPGTMDRILARRLDIGNSQCCGFRFARADEEVGLTYALVFEHPGDGTSVTFLLCTPNAQGRVTFTDLGPFRLGVRVDGREASRALRGDADVAALPGPLRGLVEMVRFVLARSLPPTLALSRDELQAQKAWGRDAGGEPGGVDGTSGPVQTSTMTRNTAWRRFFVPFEAERDLVRGFSPTDAWGRTIFFLHGELECGYIQPWGKHRAAYQRPLAAEDPERRLDTEEPAVRDALARFLDDPRAPAVPPGPGPYRPANEDESGAQAFVLMGEEEVIFGATEKLEDSLRRQRGRSRDGDMFIFNETCIAKLMGEDLQRVKRQHLAEGGAPIVELNISLPGPLAILVDLVQQMKAIVLERTSVEAQGGVIEDGVALVGYPVDGSGPEVAALLRGLGLRLTTAFLPAIGRESLMAALRSRYLLCHPGGGWREVAESLLAGPGTRVLAPDLPYGFDGVRRFLDQVADGAGVRAASEAARPSLESLFDVLRHPVPDGLGVGWILDLAEARRLVAAGGPFGVPALPFLHELGFRQVLFLHVPEPPGPLGEVRALVEAAVPVPGAVRVVPFANQEDLQRLLAGAEDVQLAYSQMTFDRRLYQCGKGTFSMSDLESGPWGARRTARRLARRCQWPGPRRFGPAVVEKGWTP